ncbi:MAG: DUF58 domain-containing protein [Propionibacteriaceae bacterium]|jgi:uncharacterized protein (DUF58 family)|nr:DUF58 domain-containing protein [Propionibacteriaceae bacterium]
MAAETDFAGAAAVPDDRTLRPSTLAASDDRTLRPSTPVASGAGPNGQTGPSSVNGRTGPRPGGGRAPRRAWTRLRARVQALGQRLWPRLLRLGEILRPVTGPLGRLLACVTPLGWTVLGFGLVGWWLSARLGWVEFGLIAAVGLLLFAISLLFVIGRTRLEVELEVSGQRVNLGQASVARFELTNVARAPLVGLGVELPVGAVSARYTTPVLPHGAAHEEWVTIPATRRGVVPVGPVRSQRGDPLGLIRREVEWTDSIDIFVHPQVASVESLGAGLLRDLEGQTTQDISNSDLAFHALRDYAPGDDQRYIHWKSTAKLSSTAGEQKFLVRQFLDTRRSHVVVIAGTEPGDYTDEEEFELVLSCAASIAVRAIRDEMDLSLICGSMGVAHPVPHLALDTYSRADFDDVPLSESFARVPDLAPDASLVVAVTGPLVGFEQLERGRVSLAPEVRLIVIRVELGADIALRETSSFVELTVGQLDDLPRALRGGLAR